MPILKKPWRQSREKLKVYNMRPLEENVYWTLHFPLLSHLSINDSIKNSKRPLGFKRIDFKHRMLSVVLWVTKYEAPISTQLIKSHKLPREVWKGYVTNKQKRQENGYETKTE